MREHWSKKYKREKSQKSIIKAYFKTYIQKNIKLPVNITLTRIAPRSLDVDNNIAGMKAHTDCIADLLIPGLAPGRADDDKRLNFNWKQKKGKQKEYGLKIEIKEI